MNKKTNKKINVAKAKHRFSKLPKKTQKADRKRKAKINTTRKWMRNPTKYDYPNVDSFPLNKKAKKKTISKK